MAIFVLTALYFSALAYALVEIDSDLKSTIMRNPGNLTYAAVTVTNVDPLLQNITVKSIIVKTPNGKVVYIENLTKILIAITPNEYQMLTKWNNISKLNKTEITEIIALFNKQKLASFVHVIPINFTPFRLENIEFKPGRKIPITIEVIYLQGAIEKSTKKTFSIKIMHPLPLPPSPIGEIKKSNITESKSNTTGSFNSSNITKTSSFFRASTETAPTTASAIIPANYWNAGDVHVHSNYTNCD
ncbi:MAG: hypothetical protein HY929_04250, partial [Euryarchaeota archaeon]|nr:hypothetical protein [Euryarchaeota archaeon]